jgi:hypothetical protein
MTPFHVQHALRMAPEAKGKTHLLKEFAKSDMKNYQVTDPMGATLEVYKRVYREIKLAIDRLLEEEFVIAPPTEDVTIPRPRPAAPAPRARTRGREARRRGRPGCGEGLQQRLRRGCQSARQEGRTRKEARRQGRPPPKAKPAPGKAKPAAPKAKPAAAKKARQARRRRRCLSR